MHFPSVCGNMVPVATVRTYVNIYTATISCDNVWNELILKTYTVMILCISTFHKPNVYAEH